MDKLVKVFLVLSFVVFVVLGLLIYSAKVDLESELDRKCLEINGVRVSNEPVCLNGTVADWNGEDFVPRKVAPLTTKLRGNSLR